jgi:hypothetical protein
MSGQCEVTTLPRGGYLVDSPVGYIQFGAPPETIKDTMRMPGGVPQIFVLTDEMFNSERGISVAEVEFPLYYNFYLRRRKTYLICRREQFAQIMAVLQESLFGPAELDIRQDCTPGARRMLNFDFLPEGYVPDIASEMAHFRAGRKLSDLLKVGFFEDDRFQIKGLTIERVDGTASGCCAMTR